LIKNGFIEGNTIHIPEKDKEMIDIPNWVKSSVGWWGDGLLPDDDFVKGIEWLISQGIIKI